MKILGLIPARGGSKGIPGKNSKMLGGKPLIQYSIDAALACTRIERVVVSTDSEAIASISKAAGAEVPFLRPAELASDQSPTIDTIIHALRFFQDGGTHFDAVCLLQPTCPFRSAEEIDEALQRFQNQEADSLVSVREVPHQYNPHWVFEADEQSGFLKIATGEKQIIPRRQALPKAYHRDGSIYITRASVLLEQNSLYGEKMSFWLQSNPVHVNIDTPEDWAAAEVFIKKNTIS